jgi:hypothetical protein
MPQIWVLIVLLIAIINVVSKASQKKQQKTDQANRPSQQTAQAKPRPLVKAEQEEEDEEEKEAEGAWPRRVGPSVPLQPLAKALDAKPLEAHMHTPVMGVEGEGTEGMDCCHEYMLSDAPAAPAADFLPMREEEETERARALLQGVIFSEILGRRPIKHYGGKRT